MKTNKSTLFSLIAMVLVPIFSCKKGSEDPAISFRSRNNRLEGKWNIVESNFIRTVISNLPSPDTSTTTIRFNDTKGTQEIKSAGMILNSLNFEGLAQIQFNKDGSARYEETCNASGTKIQSGIDATWSWKQSGNKKQAIFIESGNGTGLAYLFAGSNYTITKLSHKEIILESQYTSMTTIPGTGEVNTQSTVRNCKLERVD
jgi:hypothetical protein